MLVGVENVRYVIKELRTYVIFCFYAWLLEIYGVPSIRKKWSKEAIIVERSGSILEHILWLNDNALQGFDTINLKEVALTTCWYLWWMRRWGTHDEYVPPLNKFTFSILALVANATRICGPPFDFSLVSQPSRNIGLTASTRSCFGGWRPS
jgi:hypothetical protein